MGLDMYAYKTKQVPSSEVDFSLEDKDEPQELHYWRKHPDLHGWMEQLYRNKGGAEEFNCVPVVLTANDLEKLKDTIKESALPTTSGFFFGQSTPEDKKEDLEFVKEAQSAIKEGYTLYYTSWW